MNNWQKFKAFQTLNYFPGYKLIIHKKTVTDGSKNIIKEKIESLSILISQKYPKQSKRKKKSLTKMEFVTSTSTKISQEIPFQI